MTTVHQWYSETIYVNIDTGEQITKSEALRAFDLIRKIKKTKIDETSQKTIGVITYICECKKSQQIKLFE